jgi:hypothetical protein
MDKHRVLIFGEKVFQGGKKKTLGLDYCEAVFIDYPNEFDSRPDLSKCDLVILDYSAFLTRGSSANNIHQELFEKEMQNALDQGTNFCFLHYDDYVAEGGGLPTFSIENQIGFRWLWNAFQNGIVISKLKRPIVNSAVKRNEFKGFHDKWGTSKIMFSLGLPYKFTDIISHENSNDGNILGFTLSVNRGKIIYLPCQRDSAKSGALEACLTSLIESPITYLTRTQASIPSWAETPIFDNETLLFNRRTELEAEIQNVKSELQPYQEAKALAFLGEYDFERAVPAFFRHYLSINTYSNEQFREDFWILDSSEEKIVIAEIKTHVGGLKRTDIFKLDIHREDNKLPNTFPALLVANLHRNANSWKDKIRKIDKQDYEVAAQYNILIVRVEDLLCFWNLIVTGQKSSTDLLNYFLQEKGWMEVKHDGTITIHK